jgi:exosortase E/protease (VPEID-CTERM system)
LGALILLFTAEVLVISVWLDGDALTGHSLLIGFIHTSGAWILRGVVGFSGLYLTFAFLKHAPLLQRISRTVTGCRISSTFLATHCLALAVFAICSVALYSRGVSGAQANFFAIGWLTAGLGAIALGAISFLPWPLWRMLLQGTGYLWLYVSSTVALAILLGNSVRLLWVPAARAAFALVSFILHPFLANLTADAARMTIGTPAFSVEIAKECSGLEGIGLILTFTGLWLLLFAKEYRFPNALLLVPAGVALMFLLNAFRISALIAIGNAGAPRIATGGFHSQAGWIAFNVAAIGIIAAARKVTWFQASPVAGNLRVIATPVESRKNYTAIFLVPFLSILAAGMLSKALSSDFDWFYALRLFAAVASLWYLRRNYADLGWQPSWFGPVVGFAVFLVWVLLDPSSPSPMPGPLAASPLPVQYFWIALRVLSAVIVVPLAEELAFRCYLFRRVIDAEFQRVPLTAFTWPALVISSVLFGLLHGSRWGVGTLAGALYARPHSTRPHCRCRRGACHNQCSPSRLRPLLQSMAILVVHQRAGIFTALSFCFGAAPPIAE